jgi:imidazolonepropionase-like amidohydrolase
MRLLTAILLCILVWPGTLIAGTGVQVIKPVNVISMTDGQVTPNRAVVIKDGRILQIAAAEDLTTPEDATLIDGNHGWLIPGLAEMHAHIPSERAGEQQARDVLGLFLANGVTTARGMLGESWHLQLRTLLANRDWTGPRLVTSGPSFNGNTVSSPQQAASRAREQAAAGYDFLKLHPGLTADEFTALAEAAKSVPIPFAGHVSVDVGLDAALRQGQASIDHLDGYAQQMVPDSSPLYGTAPGFFGLNLADGLDPSRAHELAWSTTWAGVWNVPTQSLMEHIAGDTPLATLMARPAMQYVSENLAQRWRQSVENRREAVPPALRQKFLLARRALIAALQDANAGLLLGSDAPQIMNVPGFSVHEELVFLVDAGLTPLQALQTGTLNVARFFGDTDRGELKPGYVADLVLLAANPLEDITASTQILGVMRGGDWYNRVALDRLLAEIRKNGI